MLLAEKAYPVALRMAADETGLSASVFPKLNPYSTHQLFDIDFVP